MTLPGHSIDFADENEAYRYFRHNCDMGRYTDALGKVMEKTTGNRLLIGFSIGATAAWILSGRLYDAGKTTAICLYGSRIRDYLDVNPCIKTEVILPDHEPHFNVERLMSRLSEKNNVTCRKAPYGHGFMNRKSANFSEAGYAAYCHELSAVRP